ncbi:MULTISPECIES: ASCH domain-containing protein [Sphingobacterium]|nr:MULTISPECIES: ASCH domain-containing protein [Sphingobacterium]HAF36355.1 hypothetical protein [Sphingobacterium sp.]HAL53878.1 hypothetical protein [Sphingobacterium sp.]HAU54386.1 hypothetical protein [Sphingobacterium sp.]HBI89356.1 hypothetical protein [Sphingobacterium sp.]
MMSKLLLISIKEKFVNKIICGEKTIELRKSKPKAQIGDTVVIYTTQPKKAVTALAIIKNIISHTPNDMWEKYGDRLGVSKEEFDNYYSLSTKAIGIELENVHKLNDEIVLSAIKAIYPKFSPPQTFKYLNKFESLKKFHKRRN